MGLPTIVVLVYDDDTLQFYNLQVQVRGSVSHCIWFADVDNGHFRPVWRRGSN
jgi:hypothetical protein